MVSKASFLAALDKQVGRAIYVWGGNGELLTAMSDPEAWIRKCENATEEQRCIKLYRKLKAANIPSIRAFDCSGLVYWALKQAGVKLGDTSSRGFFGMCEIFADQSQLQPGDLVFRGADVDGDGLEQSEVKHVGVYVGGGYTIECYGRDVGVVSRKLAAGKWLKCGRLRLLPMDAAPSEQETTQDNGAYRFTRLLKYGVSGADVVELKKLLIAAGYSQGITVGTSSSGNFRSSTRDLVKAYQRDHGLEVDGIAGKNTITALGGVWNK